MWSRKKHVIADIHDNDEGPNYILLVRGVRQSFVAHVAVSSCLYPNIETCSVVHDIIGNTANHLSMIVNMTLSRSVKKAFISHIAWLMRKP